MHTRSAGVYRHPSPMKKPLFRMLWCDSVAPFGNPVVPLVYWILIGSSKARPAARAARSSAPAVPAAGRGGAGRDQVVPVGGAQVDHPLQLADTAADLADHRAVVAGLEALRADQQPNARLAQHVADFMAAVGRVDVDQDRADPGGRVLQQHPLRAVRRPDADPVPGVDSGREQAPGQGVGIGVQLPVGPPPSGRHVDHGLLIAARGRDPAQVRADGLAQQGQGRGSVTVGQLTFTGHDASSGRRVSTIVPVLPGRWEAPGLLAAAWSGAVQGRGGVTVKERAR